MSASDDVMKVAREIAAAVSIHHSDTDRIEAIAAAILADRASQEATNVVASAECDPNCDMGVGCDEVGVCYAEAHDQPAKCPFYPKRTK